MKQTIVAISVDKVQTFLFQVFQANIQENQSNDGTLKNIINASELISEGFYKDVESKDNEYSFGGFIKERFLQCSGSFIFSVNLEKHEAEKRLQALFKKYYKEYKGQLFLNYLCFKKSIVSDTDKLSVIKESKEKLKRSSNEVIEKNSNILFEFNYPIKANNNESKTYYDSFSNNMDNLVPIKVKEYNKSYPIAIIKGDLDGMGDLFKEITDYNKYSKVSSILSEKINIESLHNHAKRIKEKDSDFEIYPIYVAGDDIFFAVPTSKISVGISICEKIMEEINNEINNLNKESKLVSMSIGIDIASNNEPIRYYYDRVEHQLDTAKASEKLSIPHLKISINEHVFYKYNKDELKSSKSNWGHFIHTLKILDKFVTELKQLNGDSYEAHHYLYALLEKITDETILKSNIKYSNAVLYHLIPKYLESSNKNLMEAELLLIESLLKKLMIKKRNEKTRKDENELCFDNFNKKQFETYIRLLLLFSDMRFNSENSNKNHEKLDFNSKKIKSIRSTNFNKTLRYLYNNNLVPTKEYGFREIFVKCDPYEYKNENNEIKKAEIYRTLNISNSMLHKIKGMKDKKKAVDMIESSCKRFENEDETNTEVKKDSPEKLKFERKILEQYDSSLLNNEYIDSLIIFYKLNELSISYKILMSKKQKRNNGKNNDQRNTGDQSYRGRNQQKGVRYKHGQNKH